MIRLCRLLTDNLTEYVPDSIKDTDLQGTINDITVDFTIPSEISHGWVGYMGQHRLTESQHNRLGIDGQHFKINILYPEMLKVRDNLIINKFDQLLYKQLIIVIID